jgi:redox-sensitive bicupin YhaK (pirin superfamily)
MVREEFQDPALQAEIQSLVIPRTTDLGDGFFVYRALPSAQQRMVGPFVFFDQMGPVVLKKDSGLDVRPHPHIGLATVTYLFNGEILHRDSLGSVQPIRPGAVNWMTAGSGIVHSERTPPELRTSGQDLFGIQAWVALPRQYEEITPVFVHHPQHSLPFIDAEGIGLRLIAGSLYGKTAPVRTYSAMFYADVTLMPDAVLQVPVEHVERAIYILEGKVQVGRNGFDAGRLVVFRPGVPIEVRADAHTRLMLLGGEPMDGNRHVWWNFVSSSKERIEQAKEDWRSGRFSQVPGETEFIPLPERTPPPPVTYP